MVIGFCFVRNCCNDCQLIFLQYPISITVCDIVIKLIASHRCIILQSNKPKENHMTELLKKAFESELTEAEEELFDMLEQEWLTRQRGYEIGNWDYWTIPKGE